MNKEELAQKIRESEEWDMELLSQLCNRAGLEEEWKNADGETFEKVAYKAAEMLEVEILNMVVKYHECIIRPHHSGFGMYECQVTDEGWEDADDLYSAMAENVEEIIELGEDELPEGVENIRGHIYNEPTRVFAIKNEYGWAYRGIEEV